jgi:heat shock protein HslJ
VSRVAAPAIELGRARVENPGFPPFRFEIVYDAARIEPRHAYVVRATVRAAGRVIFTTDRAYPVLSGGAQSRLEMLLVRESAERTPRRPAREVVSALEGTRWKLTQVGGRDVVVRAHGREPFLVLEARQRHASGSGGCNRFTGTYESGPRTLHFGPLVATRMACPDGMRTEQAFLRALAATRRWRTEGRALVLMDGQNRVVARFEARDL